MKYKIKPEGYKTRKQWEAEGRKPAGPEVMKKYAAFETNNPKYVHEYCAYEDTVPLVKEMRDISAKQGQTVIAFDTETTGLSKWDEVLQISIVGNEGVILDTYVRPVNRKTWNKAEEINHISPEMVQSYPTAEELAPKIRAIFESADIVVGHNVGFDIGVAQRCFGVDFEGKIVVDTLKEFRTDVKEGKHKLEDAVRYYIPDRLEWFLAGAHDSKTDTIATFEVYEAMVRARNREAEDELEMR